MISRRIMLKKSTVLVLGFSVSYLNTNQPLAQDLPDLEVIFSGAFTSEREIFERFRRLSLTMIELRAVYIGPFGYENGEWAFGALHAWQDAFGSDLDEGFGRAQNDIPSFLGTDAARAIREEMSAKLSENIESYTGWMESIGIVNGSALHQDLILSQAAMTLLYSAMTPEIQASKSISLLDDVTWVWPFCGA